MDTILTTHSTLTEKLGFGLFSSTQLRRDGGLTWGQIHALTDAGLVRVERCTGDDVLYRLFFP